MQYYKHYYLSFDTLKTCVNIYRTRWWWKHWEIHDHDAEWYQCDLNGMKNALSPISKGEAELILIYYG